jgi:hypothetical protein
VRLIQSTLVFDRGVGFGEGGEFVAQVQRLALEEGVLLFRGDQISQLSFVHTPIMKLKI